MQIYVVTNLGKRIAFEVESDESIDSLKKKIYYQTDFPHEYQRLVYDGKQLKNGNTLIDHNITENAIIYMLAWCGQHII